MARLARPLRAGADYFRSFHVAASEQSCSARDFIFANFGVAAIAQGHRHTNGPARWHKQSGARVYAFRGRIVSHVVNASWNSQIRTRAAHARQNDALAQGWLKSANRVLLRHGAISNEYDQKKEQKDIFGRRGTKNRM